MIKLLVTLISLVLSCAIMALGGTMTVQNSDFDAIKSDFQVAIQTPIVPERPVDPETPADPEQPAAPDESEGETEAPSEEDGDEDIFAELFDTYNPEFADINKQVLSNVVTSVIPEESNEVVGSIDTIVSSYVNNLYGEIEKIQSENEGASEEEMNTIRDEFSQKEAEAFNGLSQIVTQTTAGHTPDEETVVDSVSSVLNSTVCLDTVTQVVNTDAEALERIQSSTESLSPEVKQEIEQMISDAYNDPENAGKESSYEALAGLFGITLGASSDDVQIPEVE